MMATDPKTLLASTNPIIVVADPAVPGGFFIALDNVRIGDTVQGEAAAYDQARLLTRWKKAVQDGDVLQTPPPVTSTTSSAAAPISSGGTVVSGGIATPTP